MKTIKVQFEDLPRQSAFSYCRKLLDQGESPDSRLEIYRNGPNWDFCISSIGEGAKWTVKENPKLKIVEWKPMPTLKVGLK